MDCPVDIVDLLSLLNLYCTVCAYVRTVQYILPLRAGYLEVGGWLKWRGFYDVVVYCVLLE
jgi:hypothetical protein